MKYKIVQIILNTTGGVFALTESGELFYGFFIVEDENRKPKWGWRKVPPIEPYSFTYSIFQEPTELQLAALRKKAKKK